jgi:hypothetical protein
MERMPSLAPEQTSHLPRFLSDTITLSAEMSTPDHGLDVLLISIQPTR